MTKLFAILSKVLLIDPIPSTSQQFIDDFSIIIYIMKKCKNTLRAEYLINKRLLFKTNNWRMCNDIF